jgi:hypothetical protein
MNEGGTIINWGMFLVLQLYEYYKMTNDREFVMAYKSRLEELLKALESFENSFGLLENLPGYLFMDWSLANDSMYKLPISTATNALYSWLLKEIGELYGRPVLSEKADDIRQKLREHAFNGVAFADSLEICDGELKARPFSSEANQYYCYWLGVGTDEQKEALDLLIEEHGPAPVRYPSNLNLAMSNVFIGLYVRLELLSMLGLQKNMMNEMKKLFIYMIENGPGTLWENLSNGASVCHGFASHAGVWLIRDFLGIGIPDDVVKTITIAPNPCGIKWAKGSIACGKDNISVYWFLAENCFKINAHIPDGYTVKFIVPREVRGFQKLTLNGKSVHFGSTFFDISDSFEFTAED